MSVPYDLDLFEQLNEEYRDRPVYTAPAAQAGPKPSRAEAERAAAERNLAAILKQVDLAGKVVLELGCGHGWLTALLPERAGAVRAIGVDIERYSSWEEHADPRVELVAGDLSVTPLVEPASVDVVVSRVTFEHVSRPLQMLQALYETLAFGGKLWVRTNLYRARNASHRYREVHFPWPHLLFEDEVCEAFYLKHHGRPQRYSWVNGMTVAHYLLAARDAGFEIASWSCHRTPIDLEFYGRFEGRLGRYPALDLETDFLMLVLDKVETPSGTIPDVGYLERQRELDAALAAYRQHEGAPA